MFIRNRHTRRAAWALACTGVLFSCTDDQTHPGVRVPGKHESTKTQVLEAGAQMLQSQAPLRGFDSYLSGFHFASGEPRMQMEAHHYCGHLNEDVIQCVLFDGRSESSRLTGIEYVITRRLFEKLPPEEKQLWHSHAYEVRSGQLIAPGIPDVAEHELMEKLAGTYGKTWHTWHTNEGANLPLGIPHLMMGFTADGQVNADMVADRDRRFEVSSEKKRKRRADITYPPIDAQADAWTHGPAPQLQLKE